MLRPSALRSLLSQVTVGTIQASFLLNRSGEVLDVCIRNEILGLNSKNVGAILCSVFQSYHKFGTSLEETELNYLFVDCDSFRLAIRPVGPHLICLCADSNTSLGVLKLKIKSLADSFSTHRTFF